LNSDGNAQLGDSSCVCNGSALARNYVNDRDPNAVSATIPSVMSTYVTFLHPRRAFKEFFKEFLNEDAVTLLQV
jgi:hypothetical protein